mmetsp:Transcript_75509/g.244360  ORF Transcript_75509/g.244360 Transcript_75509/m.244360 type:complete len:213 (-) Transcript_75509:1028-1666(-)
MGLGRPRPRAFGPRGVDRLVPCGPRRGELRDRRSGFFQQGFEWRCECMRPVVSAGDCRALVCPRGLDQCDCITCISGDSVGPRRRASRQRVPGLGRQGRHRHRIPPLARARAARSALGGRAVVAGPSWGRPCRLRRGELAESCEASAHEGSTPAGVRAALRRLARRPLPGARAGAVAGALPTRRRRHGSSPCRYLGPRSLALDATLNQHRRR